MRWIQIKNSIALEFSIYAGIVFVWTLTSGNQNESRDSLSKSPNSVIKDMSRDSHAWASHSGIQKILKESLSYAAHSEVKVLSMQGYALSSNSANSGTRIVFGSSDASLGYANRLYNALTVLTIACITNRQC
jgi:hypothetical protein